MNITIFHNSRCSKSRRTLELLNEKGFSPTIVEYLNHPPNAATIKSLLKKLDLKPRELMRPKETIFGELNLSDPGLSDDHLIDAMVEHPILIERPIVVFDEKAVIGRPPENIEALF